MARENVSPPAFRPIETTTWRTGQVLQAGFFGLVVAGLAALLLPLYDAPSIGTDSGNLLSIARLTFESGLSPLLEKQAPPLTILVYGLMMKLGVPFNALPVLTAFLLPLVLAGMVYWQTRSWLVAAVPILIVASSRAFWLQNTSLSPYAAYVLLGYVGVFLSGRWALGRAGSGSAVSGAIFIAAALYTFGQALPYLVVPSLFLILAPTKQTLGRLAYLYLLLGLMVTPWVVSHLAVGGINEFYHYPRSWLASNYGEYIKEFWGRRYYDSVPLYLVRTVQVVVYYILPEWAWPLFAGSLYGIWRYYGASVVLFLAALVIVFAVPVVVTMSPIFPRYWYSLLPLFALVIAAGVHLALPSLSQKHLVIGVVMIFLASMVSTNMAGDFAYENNVVREISAQRDLERFAGLIQDNKGILSRDARIQSLATGSQAYNNLLMTQSDFVTYLTWPDDAAVNAVMERYAIGWVLLYNDFERWEIGYNSWLPEAAGQVPLHYKMIRNSSLVAETFPGEVYTLYRLKGP